MDGLEQRTDRDPLTAAQILAQLGHHPLLFGENDIYGDRVVCFSNTRCGIAARCLDAEADQLPWRRHPIHDGQKGVQKEFAIPCSCALDQLFAFFELSVGEIAYLQR